MNHLERIKAGIAAFFYPLSEDGQQDDAELLQSISETDQIELATAAAILLVDLAWSDGEFETPEGSFIERKLLEKFQLSRKDLQDVLAYAQARASTRRGSYSFFEHIRHQYSSEQKQQLLELVSGVIASDNEVEPIEAVLKQRFETLFAK